MHSEKLIKDMATRMVKDGFLAAGYEYITVDDCWPLHDRAKDGRLVPDPKRFPSGMKALADFVSLFIHLATIIPDFPLILTQYLFPAFTLSVGYICVQIKVYITMITFRLTSCDDYCTFRFLS